MPGQLTVPQHNRNDSPKQSNPLKSNRHYMYDYQYIILTDSAAIVIPALLHRKVVSHVRPKMAMLMLITISEI